MQVELRRIQAAVGITFVYVTHDQEEALSMSDRIVVMRNGRIEQIGTTDDVYDRPATLWVSDFVGSSSHIAGSIRVADSGAFMVDTDLAPIKAQWAAPGLGAGDRAVAVKRPEHVEVTPGAGDAVTENAISARVAEILNLGSQAKLVALTPGGVELTATVSRMGLDPAIRPGEPVRMRFGADAVRLYAPEAEGNAGVSSAQDEVPA
jgi:ABC-type Fe3+/spermidine/putrescine transport system ATPase subunit